MGPRTYDKTARAAFKERFDSKCRFRYYGSEKQGCKVVYKMIGRGTKRISTPYYLLKQSSREELKQYDPHRVSWLIKYGYLPAKNGRKQLSHRCGRTFC